MHSLPTQNTKGHLGQEMPPVVTPLGMLPTVLPVLHSRFYAECTSVAVVYFPQDNSRAATDRDCSDELPPIVQHILYRAQSRVAVYLVKLILLH